MSKKIILTEDEITNKLFDFLHQCDGDVLASISELAFGGTCSAIDDHYEFVPNEYYTGDLGKPE